MVTLSPCPFCGGQPGYSRVPGQGFSILCNGCGALAVHAKLPGRDELGAAWNRREQRHNFNVKSRVKPCPFCSSRAGIKKMAHNDSILLCERCGMMVSFALADGLDATVAAWNRRK